MEKLLTLEEGGTAVPPKLLHQEMTAPREAPFLSPYIEAVALKTDCSAAVDPR